MTASINGNTRVVGLLGWPVSHSFSPAMHNAAAAEAGLNLVYVPLPTTPDAIPAAVAGVRALGLRGVNVTVPHKQAVMPFLDEIDPHAQAIGAVNTIVVTQPLTGSPARLIGYNSDYAGFLADLRAQGVKPAGSRALILGAGGSARAVAYALVHSGAHVRILSRRPDPAVQIVDELARYVDVVQLHAGPLSELARHNDVNLVINCTPVGMHPDVDASPWPADVAWPDRATVYDLIYNPADTQLMQRARAAGGQAFNGLGMLVHQGAIAFEKWFNLHPDVNVMRAAALGDH